MRSTTIQETKRLMWLTIGVVAFKAVLFIVFIIYCCVR